MQLKWKTVSYKGERRLIDMQLCRPMQATCMCIHINIIIEVIIEGLDPIETQHLPNLSYCVIYLYRWLKCCFVWNKWILVVLKIVLWEWLDIVYEWAAQRWWVGKSASARNSSSNQTFSLIEYCRGLIIAGLTQSYFDT